MNYKGQGFLVGYKTYEKEGVRKHVYYVINGNKNAESGLYSDCEFIAIYQDTQTLKELKPQVVLFEVASQTFAGQTKNRFLNIQSVE